MSLQRLLTEMGKLISVVWTLVPIFSYLLISSIKFLPFCISFALQVVGHWSYLLNNVYWSNVSFFWWNKFTGLICLHKISQLRIKCSLETLEMKTDINL